MEQRIRENEEFMEPGAEHTRSELIRWHQDCSTMLQELGALKGKDQYIEMCLKLNADAQKWKFHFECGKQEQTKLVQEVNTLKTQLETVEGQLKVSLDSENNSREELEKMQQVAKFALMWGKAFDAKGKLPAEQKVFLEMLQKQEAECQTINTPPTYDISSSEIESIASSSSESESASSREPGNRTLPVNERATHSSIQSLECEKSSSFYATTAKKTRTQSEEHHPSPFLTPAVDRSRLDEVILPCDPREGFKSPQSPDGVEEDDDEDELIDISSSTGSTGSEIPPHQIQPEEEDDDEDEFIYFSSSTGSEIPELFSPLPLEVTKSNCTFSWTSYNLPFSPSNQSTFGNPPGTNDPPSIGTSEDSSSSFQHSAPASGPLELPPVGHPSSVPEDSSTLKSEEEESTVAEKPPSQPSQKVAPAPTILPVRRKVPTQSSIPETAPIKAETQPRTVPSSGTKVTQEVQPELIHSPGSSSSSDSLTIDLDPPHYNQGNHRITCASKRNLERDKSASSYMTPTKKARAPSGDHHPSPFSRPIHVVNKGPLKEAMHSEVADVIEILTSQPSDNTPKDVHDDLMESATPLSVYSTGKGAVHDEESPASLEDFESPQSPDDAVVPVETTVAQISKNDEPQLSAFQIASEVAQQQQSTDHVRASRKVRRGIYCSLNKLLKASEMNAELLSKTVDCVLQPDSIQNPSDFIRSLIGILKNADAVLDVSRTLPASPLVTTQQRCIILLKAVDAKRVEIYPTKTDSPHYYSDVFLSEVSSFMFQTNSSITLDGMCALARIYTALARSRGLMDQARSFLYDCFYFFPSRCFALTCTVLSVWTEVLRHATFPTGLTVMDHSVVYLLLHCCKVGLVPGEEGKVLQMRSFMEITLGYKNLSYTSVNDLIVFLVSQLSKTHSVDEAFSIHRHLLLLPRWEGVDLAINIIRKHLWPFLQRWSIGDGTNAGAASAIKCIGALGKSILKIEKSGVKVKKVLRAMKTILDCKEADTIIQEAAAETVILLGEEEEPNTVVEVLKNWKPRSKPSAHLQKVMCFFLRRQSTHNDKL